MGGRPTYQNVPWSIGCLTWWWNLWGLIIRSDVLDAFSLLTVLYKLDTASYRDRTHMSCFHWKGVPQDLYHDLYLLSRNRQSV